MSELMKRILGLKQQEPIPATPIQSIGDEPESPPPPQNHAANLGLYDAVRSGWYLSDTDEIFKGVRISAEDVVLDLGCGDGGAIHFCAMRGAHVIGIDIDAEAIAHVEKRLSDTPARAREFIVSDSVALPLADGLVTRVICTEVLEHVDDPAVVLAELVRVGKPGARYLFSVPDALGEEMQKKVAPDSYFQKPNHIRIIGREEFRKMVADAGLVVEEQSFYGFFWSVWWAFFWSCKTDLSSPQHPILDHWTRTWQAVLDLDDGGQLKRQLDAFMPKSQVIVAHKP